MAARRAPEPSAVWAALVLLPTLHFGCAPALAALALAKVLALLRSCRPDAGGVAVGTALPAGTSGLRF